MKSAKTYVLLLLTATTIGGAVLAWRQYAELVELRAAAMNRSERSDLHQRIWDLEKQNRELQDRLAVREPSDLAALAEASATERPAGDRSFGGRGGRGPGGRDGFQQQANAFRELMNKPEVQAMLSLQQKAAIDARYGALFKNLNLSPEQQARLSALLAESRTTRRDVEEAARAQGINPRDNPDAFRKLITDAQNEVNASIKGVIGEAGFAQLQSYEQTLPQRSLVNDLQQRLSTADAPLSSTQADQLVQILAANSPARTSTNASTTTPPAAPPDGRGFGPPGGRGGELAGMLAGGGPMFDGARSATITDAAVAQSQTVLTPTQLSALQQMQRQQQAQQQLQQIVRETLASGQAQPGATSSSGTTSSGGTTPAPARKRPGS